METVRVNICYRPLRICWAIAAGDIEAFRKAVRQSLTMWGGRFNPIVVVDRDEEAKRLIEVFRADLIVPIGASDKVNEFPKRFAHLINPFFPSDLFVAGNGRTHAHLLDIHNALVHLRDKPEWRSTKEHGMHLYDWSPDDPLADVFLAQVGAYPPATDLQIDYRAMVKEAAGAAEHQIERTLPIPGDLVEHFSAAQLSRFGMRRHYSVRTGWNYPGFFLGDVTNVDDLVCCWNLRATDTPLWFVDKNNIIRYGEVIPAWMKMVKAMLSHRETTFPQGPAIWEIGHEHSEAHSAELRRIFGAEPLTICGVDIHSWNGMNLKAPMMFLGETAQLGVLETESDKPRLSFALGDKPFCGDGAFHTQHLVASLSFIGGLYSDELHTLDPPYVPELNEFYARTMHLDYNKLRIEPERVGLIIDAADTDAFIKALPVRDLVERIFRLAGLSAKPSSGGLITRQLIAQMGGLRGASVFKIPGVRRLLRTHGPTDTFTKRSALQLIGGKDPDNPAATFAAHEDLFIESRPIGTKLTCQDVFTYLVDKRLFRIGVELHCPHCRMASWTALDALKQRVICEMCGVGFDATRQLVNGEYRYRRSGVLGAEKNALGAVPVALTLQQLEANLSHTLRDNMYSTSLDIQSQDGGSIPRCEVDFVWVVREAEKTIVILGECKDRGRNDHAADGGTINANDIANLEMVADALPSERFETYVLLAKLCPFTNDEINAAGAINDQYRQRVILLTDRELEPWHLYERAKSEFAIDQYAGTGEAMARNTARMYFKDASK